MYATAVKIQPPAVVMGGTSDVLATIHDPTTEIAVWQRRLSEAITENLQLSCWPESERFCCDVVDIAQTMDEILPDAPKLAADITTLAQQFAALFSASQLRVRMETVTGNACKKFHVDYVRARLITTYLGGGSEWGYSHEGNEPTDVQQFSTGDVTIFKGARYEGYNNPTVLHRSPPIAGTGLKRYVLCIDLAEGSFAPE